MFTRGKGVSGKLLVKMSVVADIAQALGISQKAVREALNRAAVADAVLAIILAGQTRVQADYVASVAGVTKAELSGAVLRYHDHHHRELMATQAAFRNGTRKRHAPVGKQPSPDHMWCKRAGHWVLQSEMGRNTSRASGYGDWCKPCWREYWKTKVKGREPVAPE